MDSVDPAGNTALIKAAGAGQTGAVERLLGMGADPRKVNGVGRDALLAASAKGYEEVARLLLSRGADTTVRDAEGWGALSIAAFNGHANVVSLLAANATPRNSTTRSSFPASAGMRRSSIPCSVRERTSTHGAPKAKPRS